MHSTAGVSAERGTIANGVIAMSLWILCFWVWLALIQYKCSSTEICVVHFLHLPSVESEQMTNNGENDAEEKLLAKILFGFWIAYANCSDSCSSLS